MVGMFLVGAVLAAAVVPVGHAGSYWLIAVMFAITIALSPLVFSQYRPDPAQRCVREPLRTELRALLANPQARRMAAVEASIQALSIYYAFYIVVIAVKHLGPPATGASSLVAVQGVAFVGALFALGGVVTRLGARTVPLAVTLVALAATLLGLLFVPLFIALAWHARGAAELAPGPGAAQISR